MCGFMIYLRSLSFLLSLTFSPVWYASRWLYYLCVHCLSLDVFLISLPSCLYRLCAFVFMSFFFFHSYIRLEGSDAIGASQNVSFPILECFTEIERILLRKHILSFVVKQMVHRMYIRYGREQSGVVEWSDADDRLRSIVDARLQSDSIENIKNIAMKLVMMILHIRICVQLDSLVNKRSFRKGCANR